ncbi:MAG: transcriptional regulator [Deltaproteobacteria bacterium]|nr:transcriptional regulator [Deltaproteobacteria bacterium]
MSRGDQIERQWRIMQILLSSHYGKTVTDLADRFECSQRTIYRDMEALQLAGFPLYNDRVDGASRWSLMDTAKQRVPIPFSYAELMALYFSRDLLKIFRDTVFYEALDSLFEKITATLPPAAISYLERVQETLFASLKPAKTYTPYREVITRLNTAAIEKKSIEMDYYTMSRKDETRRTVDPYQLCFLNGSFYLIGLCHLRQQIRTFALDRISNLEVTDRQFTVPGDFRMEDFLKSSFGIHRGAPQHIRIRFDADAAGYIREKIWHESQRIIDDSDGGIVLEIDVAGTEEIKYWIRSWGPHAEVLEPMSLRDEMKADFKAATKRYGSSKKTDGR